MIYLSEDRIAVEKEFIRLGFDKDGKWRISDVNKDFQLCNTYPRFLIVPSTFKDEHLPGAAKFRYFSRIPTAVWRHLKNGCFIVRSSQPTVGWFGWFRTEVNELDEGLVQSYVKNTVPPESERFEDDNDNDQDRSIDNSDDAKLTDGDGEKDENNDKTAPPPRTPTPTPTTPSPRLSSTITLESDTNSETSISAQPDQSLALNGNGTLSSDISTTDKTNTTITSRILIIDARSYTAAMANRAKGGGCECAEYYQRCEVLFMNLANIHSIRKSFYAIRSVCDAYSEQSNK